MSLVVHESQMLVGVAYTSDRIGFAHIIWGNSRKLKENLDIYNNN